MNIFRKEYELFIELDSQLKKGTKYWSPVGLKSNSIESAKRWLKADFNIWKEQPNIRYKIIETTYYKEERLTVEEGSRQI